MEKPIRLNHDMLHRMVMEEVVRILQEDGAFGGDAFGGDAVTPGATSDSADRVGPFDVSFGVQSKGSIYQPKKKDSKMTKVDMSPALKRHDGKGGSISIPKDRK